MMSYLERYPLPRRHYRSIYVPVSEYAACFTVQYTGNKQFNFIFLSFQSQGIKFFLFAPGLTIIGLTRHANIICVGYTATYENGAKVNTSFVTNMTDNLIESSSKLYKRLENADKENLRKIKKKQLPKYTYPDNILTACRMNTLSRYGVDFAIKRENGYFMRDLDSQRKFKKGIFGCGYLISGKKAAELKAAELKAAELKAAEHVWELSEREKEIIKTLK